MKKLLLLAILCMGFTFAKAQGLIIKNRTACDVHFLVYGDPSVGGCGTSYRSSIMTIGGTPNPLVPTTFSFTDPNDFALQFPPGMTSGGTTLTTGWFSAFRFPQCNPAYCPGCSTSSVAVGDASCGLSSSASQSFLNAACVVSSCGTVNITYLNSGGNVTIEIN